MRAAGRRFLTFFAAAAGVALLLGVLMATVGGTPFRRALSLALYLLGAFLLVIAFFAGSRGPLRLERAGGGVMPVGRPRRATSEERAEMVGITGLLLAIGVLLLVLGAIVDDRHELA